MFDRLSAVVAVTGMMSAAAWAQAPAAPTYKPGEGDLVLAIQKETDPAKKVQELKDWAQKFPDSDFKSMRAVMIIQTEGGPVMKAAQTGAGADAALPQAKDLADNINDYFSDGNRQPSTTPAQWAGIKQSIDVSAHTVLAMVAFNKKTPEGDAEAEVQYKKLIGLSPATGYYAYQLGTLILREKNVARIPEGLYYIARGVGATGTGALPAAVQKPADDYLTKAYEGYHGDTKGLDDLKKLAMTSPNPPEGFKIVSVTEADAAATATKEAFAKDHPDLALWETVKAALTAPDGQNYFDSGVKGSGLPPGDAFKFFPAKFIEQKSPKEILVQVDPADGGGDAILTFTDPLKGTIDPGTEFKFKGTVDAFAKDPFIITFTDMDKDDVDGLPVTLFEGAKTPKKARTPAKKK